MGAACSIAGSACCGWRIVGGGGGVIGREGSGKVLISEVSSNLGADGAAVCCATCAAGVGKAPVKEGIVAGVDFSAVTGSGDMAWKGVDVSVPLPFSTLERLPFRLCFSSTDAIPHANAAARRSSKASTD